jgi:hypothetical protein
VTGALGNAGGGNPAGALTVTGALGNAAAVTRPAR